MRRFLLSTSFLLVFASPAIAQGLPPAPVNVLAQNIDDPVAISTPRDRTGRLFDVERTGKIRIFLSTSRFGRPLQIATLPFDTNEILIAAFSWTV
jgi:hypothetical protein